LLRVKSNIKDLGISAGSRLGLKKTDGLKTGNNSESQANPKRIGVEYLKSSSGGGKEVISESSLGGVLLWEEESEDGQLGKSAVHDFNLTVTDEFLWGSLGGETSGVEEAYRREVSNKTSGVYITLSEGDVLLSLSGSILDGAGGRKSTSAVGNRSRSKGGGASDEGGDNSELHGGSVEVIISEIEKNGSRCVGGWGVAWRPRFASSYVISCTFQLRGRFPVHIQMFYVWSLHHTLKRAFIPKVMIRSPRDKGFRKGEDRIAKEEKRDKAAYT